MKLIDANQITKTTAYYEFDDGTLIVAGTGPLSNHTWTPWPNTIRKVYVLPGITEIGTNFFGVLQHLTSVELPDTLERIRKCAFADCSDLAFIHIPAAVKCIESGAFDRCTSLRDVRLPANVRFEMAYDEAKEEQECAEEEGREPDFSVPAEAVFPETAELNYYTVK